MYLSVWKRTRLAAVVMVAAAGCGTASASETFGNEVGVAFGRDVQARPQTWASYDLRAETGDDAADLCREFQLLSKMSEFGPMTASQIISNGYFQVDLSTPYPEPFVEAEFRKGCLDGFTSVVKD